MMSRAASLSVVAILCTTPALAAELPKIKAGSDNTVPACVTPGRLMAFVQGRNPGLDRRFDVIATEYMRHGEMLGIRWDYAFFQMLVETGNLTFKGDVRPAQNNFAGLGATGGGEPGESFKDVSTGVRAHLEHVLMYSGERIDQPTAERTRKVQEWGVLTSWQKSIKGAMTFTHLTRKWSPTDRGYSKDIASIGDSFLGGACREADPRPELVQAARANSTTAKLADAVAPVSAPEKVSGAELARRALDEARANGDGNRAGLGAAGIAAVAAKPAPEVTVLNAPKPPAASPPATSVIEPVTLPQQAASAQAAATAQQAAATQKPAKSDAKSKDAKESGTGSVVLAAAAPAAAAGGTAAAATVAPGKCRVWQASYGGQKAVIIQAQADQQTNYTVLDVNDGAEKREAEAYIAAYAKGGQTVGEFPTSTQALDKAFELCPEG